MNRQEFHNMVASSQGYMYEAGRKAEYDEFWDNYQDNGNRTDYSYAFANYGWTEKTFKPKYPICPTKAEGMFMMSFPIPYEAIKGVDFSRCTYFYNTFAYCRFKHIGVVDMSKSTQSSYAFYGSPYVHTIDKVILSPSNSFNATFLGLNKLENIVIEGEIGQNNFDMKDSTLLTKASITSIVNALSSTTSGLSITLSKTAVNNAFAEAEWSALKATKSNWTITLV